MAISLMAWPSTSAGLHKDAVALQAGVCTVGSAGVPPAGFGMSPKPIRGSQGSVGETPTDATETVALPMSIG